MKKNCTERNSSSGFKQHRSHCDQTLKENVAPWAARAAQDSATPLARAADTGTRQNLSPQQPAILRDRKQPQGLKLTSMSFLLKFADHKWNI